MTHAFIRALATAIALHELLYIFRDGKKYLTLCFMPTLGLQLSPRAHALAHAALMAGCAGLLVRPAAAWLLALTTGAFAVVVASYSLRLSNHFVLVGFMLVLVLLASQLEPSEPLVRLGLRGLLTMTYGFAFLHKCNADFLSEGRSAASQLIEFQAHDRGLRDQRLLRAVKRFAIYGTLLYEGGLAAMLASSSGVWLVITLALATGFHFVLALAGIVNFSAVMYAGLVGILPHKALEHAAATIVASGPLAWSIAVGACSLIVWAVTPREAGPGCPYVYRTGAWVVQLGFGAATALMFLSLPGLLEHPPARDPAWAMLGLGSRLTLAALWGAFALNGLTPYLGLKTEFSFAMFSNLRHRPWNHLWFPAQWRPFDSADYVRLRTIDGLPGAREVRVDPAAELALQVLQNGEGYLVSRRFLFEGLQRIARAAPDAPLITVRYAGRDAVERVVRAGGGWAPRQSRWRATLFPFVLPLDPDRPHSEQGTIFTEGTRRRVY